MFGFSLAVLAVAGGLKLWRELRRPLTALLPDGSTLELMAWRIDHRYELRMPPSWGSLGDRLVPPRVRQMFPVGRSIALATVESDDKGPRLFIALRHSATAISSSYFPVRVRLEDEDGQAVEIGAFSFRIGIGADQLQVLQAPAFPRRGKELMLKIDGRLRNNPMGPLTRLATLRLPNAAFGNYPQWTPEPMPQTRTNGDLVGTLVSAHTGVWWSEDPDFRSLDERPGTLLVFRSASGVDGRHGHLVSQR